MKNVKKLTTVYQSLTRPILLIGAERENVILLACVCLSLCTVGRDVLSLSLALLVWTVGLILSKISARHDPWGTKVFIRSLSYRDYYPAREKMITPSCVIRRKRNI
ncbi:MAG: VirB3 family type IV secretion system protein [Candidatus Omnitrophica bacterium]|nr:VirB3 family type IV secretion system protein [Candidatus Omnitrophota bacterium]